MILLDKTEFIHLQQLFIMVYYSKQIDFYLKCAGPKRWGEKYIHESLVIFQHVSMTLFFSYFLLVISHPWLVILHPNNKIWNTF